MTNEELAQKLRDGGHQIGDPVLRTDGMLLLLIDNVYMFRPDAVDLATGAAALDQIIERNRGKVFPDAPAD
jgi:hypothetical protein